jgi:2-dehydro-3-deoxyphosphogluconate aldolase/(4S)-4-hydroxy-2-oxoglutarate aldolase
MSWPVPGLDVIAALRLLPVLVVREPDDATAIGEALVAGGLPLAEVTLRTPAARQVTREMAEVDEMTVGVGSVTAPPQVTEALAAGARFIVCPGLSRDVVWEGERTGIPVIPGIANATELMHAVEAGITMVKFYPAEAAGGRPAIRALAGPFPQARLIPTGGVSSENFIAYLRLSSVIGVGGSWIVPPEATAETRKAEITERTAVARRAIEDARA